MIITGDVCKGYPNPGVLLDNYGSYGEVAGRRFANTVESDEPPEVITTRFVPDTVELGTQTAAQTTPDYVAHCYGYARGMINRFTWHRDDPRDYLEQSDFYHMEGAADGLDTYKQVLRGLGAVEDDAILEASYFKAQQRAEALFEALDIGGGEEPGGGAHDGMVSFRELARLVRFIDGAKQYAVAAGADEAELDMMAELEAADEWDGGVMETLAADESVAAHQALALDGVLTHRERSLTDYLFARALDEDGISFSELFAPIDDLQLADRQTSGELATVDH